MCEIVSNTYVVSLDSLRSSMQSPSRDYLPNCQLVVENTLVPCKHILVSVVDRQTSEHFVSMSAICDRHSSFELCVTQVRRTY